MGVTRADVINIPKNIGAAKTTTYHWEGSDYPLKIDNTVAKLVTQILNVSEASPDKSYTSIIMSGKSSSGKSTLTQTLCHRLSCERKIKWNIKWFDRHNLLDLGKIIDSLEKGLRYILIFDDVSYVLDSEDVKPKQKQELAAKLTYIRHDLGGKVITIMNIHFMTALMPIFRDADFKILTSMSYVDRKNWSGVLGKSADYSLNTFQKQFASQMKNHYFYVNGIKTQDGKGYVYYVNKPFRCALVSEMEGVRTLLYPKEGCEVCAKKKEKTKSRKEIPAPDYFKKAIRKSPATARTAIRYWAYFTLGRKDALPKNNKASIQHILDVAQEYAVDEDQLIEYIRGTHHQNSLKIPDGTL